MADTKRPAKSKANSMDKNQQNAASIPAIHHVGPTLESDPEFADLETHDMTPEGRIAKIGVPPENTVTRAATDLSADVNSTDELPKLVRNAEPEPLKTRLPGDTSSDPHTDLGPDNATAVQHGGDGRE